MSSLEVLAPETEVPPLPARRRPAPAIAVRGTVAAPVLNAFSVDVEDYFQVVSFENAIRREDWERLEPRVERNTRRLLELCARSDVRGTFFVLGWVAERFPGLVRDIRAAGHELGTHGQDHRRVTTLTPAQFRADVRRSKATIEDTAGVEVIGYRAPNYSIVRETLWAMDILAEEGFRYDSSIFPIRHDRYGIPDFPRFPKRMRGTNGTALHEFPISTIRLAGMNLPFVGGGYLRHFPLAFIRWGMRRLNREEHRPAMVYIHPWELDPDQPRQQVGWLTRVRHYRNLAATEDRLARLFNEYRFGTVREVLGL
jgi:polysaccharide deacetylase family protein (PEP-CTERM system associated)